jgi:hypothetical protein
MNKRPRHLGPAAVARRLKWSIIIDQLKNHPCSDCKNSFPPVAMDFDHVRGEKKFGIALARMGNYTAEKILAEVAKCDLVCANCHRIRTAKRRGEI